ncbi:hypothetical protein LEP1GSC039_3907 [Leptospira santarosai str. 2000027870]|nr:hypothetical protein LEP1GSC039_3907 [Leptospira santarosai str. 2000027870]
MMSRNLYKIQNKALRIKFPYKIVVCDRITKPKTYCIEVPSVKGSCSNSIFVFSDVSFF